MNCNTTHYRANSSSVPGDPTDPAFRNGLNLDDAGDTLRLLDPAGDEVLAFAYGDRCRAQPCEAAVSDRSLTRSPELSGGFVPHDEVGDDLLSPGRRADGTPFGEP